MPRSSHPLYVLQDKAAGTTETDNSSSADIHSSEVCGSLRKGRCWEGVGEIVEDPDAQ